MMNFRKSTGLIFGIYPGSGVGIDPGSGVINIGLPDEPEQIKKALNILQVNEKPFIVRGYIQYTGSGKSIHVTPANMEQYVTNDRKLDLTLCYRSNNGDMYDWTNYIGSIIKQYHLSLAKIQITEEPNNPDAATGGDGSSPGIYQAIIEGVIAAKGGIKKLDADIQVGFNAVPSFNPNDTFWNEIAKWNSPSFIESLDFAGLDFFPGVFRPLPPHVCLKDAVIGVLAQFRNINLVAGRIPAGIPIHITENGWPTSETRSESEQESGIREVIETIYEKRAALNITHYEFFDLRDADSSKQELQFGLLRDDYSAKPAFNTFCKLVREFS